jgi:hypothetical protein
MKRALFVLLAVIVLAGLSGCCNVPMGCSWLPGFCNTCPGTCQSSNACEACRGRGCGLCCGAREACDGPPTGAITYPYYTNRGPRDFLAQDPRGIGP